MSAVPIIIASQNGVLNIYPTVSYSLAIISCIIIISICLATIFYGSDTPHSWNYWIQFYKNLVKNITKIMIELFIYLLKLLL